MNNLKFFLVGSLLLTYLISSCGISEYGLSPQSRTCYAFIKKFGTRVQKERGFSLGAIGGGSNNGFWLMTAGFNRYGPPLTKEEARRLIFSLAKDFLDDINSNLEVLPYLRDYPFSENNIDLSIFNYNLDRRDVFDPYISSVCIAEGEVYYFIKNQNQKHGYKPTEKETYEEGLKKLKQESMGNGESYMGNGES